MHPYRYVCNDKSRFFPTYTSCCLGFECIESQNNECVARVLQALFKILTKILDSLMCLALNMELVLMIIKYNPYPGLLATTYFCHEVREEAEAFSCSLALLTYHRYLIECGILSGGVANSDFVFLNESALPHSSQSLLIDALARHNFNKLSSALLVGEHSLTKSFGYKVAVTVPGCNEKFEFPVSGMDGVDKLISIIEAYNRFLFGSRWQGLVKVSYDVYSLRGDDWILEEFTSELKRIA